MNFEKNEIQIRTIVQQISHLVISLNQVLDERCGGRDSLVLCIAADAVQLNLDQKKMEELDLDVVRTVLAKGPFDELRKIIQYIRHLLVTKIQWDPDHGCGYLNFSEGSMVSNYFERMFYFDSASDMLSVAISKLLALCINKFVSVENPRLHEVPMKEVKKYFVYLAKAIHRVLVFCDITEKWAEEPLNLRFHMSKDENSMDVVSTTVIVPSTEVILQKLLQIHTIQTLYPSTAKMSSLHA